MSKVSINESTLTAIGNAIRAKTGKSDLLAPGAMPAEIASIQTGGGSGGGTEVEPIHLRNNAVYACAGPLAGKYIELFGNTITTEQLYAMNYMFAGCIYKKPTFPYEINPSDATGTDIQMTGMFQATDMDAFPVINNAKPYNLTDFFKESKIRNIPEYLYATWDWSVLHSSTYGKCNGMFNGCSYLRSIPQEFLKNLYSPGSGTYGVLAGGFSNCYVLDELIGVPIQTGEVTSNGMGNAVIYCYRLKNLIFATNDDGTAKVAKMRKQTLDLTQVGYGALFVGNECDLTYDTLVDSDERYQALKDNPDWWAKSFSYSRYNHDSAVNTINSLPDCSAYIGTSTSYINTIKFKGAAGSATDGGAINTLTEEEIAVATAKGWTVTLA
jgi:hypothetical protein